MINNNVSLLTAFGIIEKFYWKMVIVNQTEDTFVVVKDITNEKYRSPSFKSMWNKVCEKYVDEEYAEKFINFMQSNRDENYMVYQRTVKDIKAWMLIEKYKIDDDNFLYCTRAVDQELMTLIFNKKEYQKMAYTDSITGFYNYAALNNYLSNNKQNEHIILIKLDKDVMLGSNPSYKDIVKSYIHFANKLRVLLKDFAVFNGPSDYFVVMYNKNKNNIVSFFDKVQETMNDSGYKITWIYVRK